MEYYSVSSEVQDTLEFLRPSNRRTVRRSKRKGVYSGDCGYSSHFVKDYRREVTEQSSPNDNPSSTSLILQKTKERKINGHHPVINYAAFLQHSQNFLCEETRELNLDPANKPLIKVTVIPKAAYTRTNNSYRKRGPCKKRIQNTASNHENQYKTKNVYLVVAGRRKEKVYRIKATGSATLSSENLRPTSVRHEEIHVHELSKLVTSLDMEKTKKKEKKRRDDLVSKTSRTSLVNHIFGNEMIYRECKCSHTALNDETFTDLKSGKSRLRITGRLGLTEDDRYVLKCAATLNDQPIATSFDQVESSVLPLTRGIRNERKYCRNFNTVACMSEGVKKTRMESQATQANLSPNISNHDQYVQCNYHIASDSSSHAFDTDKEAKSLKDCQSLVVVISVYPKGSETTKGGENINEIARRAITLSTKITDQKSVRPQQFRINRANLERNSKKSVSRALSRSPSPSVRNADTQKTQERQQTVNKVKNITVKGVTDKNNPSPERVQQKTKPSKNPESITRNAKLMTDRKQGCNEKQPQEAKGTNTGQILAKKMLIADFMKKSNRRMNQRTATENFKSSQNNAVSNISVNIDGEHEYYDLQYRQDNLTTDLKVKKTLKLAKVDEKRTNCTKTDGKSSPSMENFLLLAHEGRNRNRSFSKNLFDLPTNKLFSNVTDPVLKVRDSLELSHRRDERPGFNAKNVQTYATEETNSDDKIKKDHFATRHYRGDNCTVANPVERDKEIRELLGVAVGSRLNISSKNVQGYRHEKGDSVLVVYERKCQNSHKNQKKSSYLEYNERAKHNVWNLETLWRPKPSTKTIFTQYEINTIRTSPCQQVLNSSLRMMLQVEKIRRQKPIILTRKQYDKMKRTLLKNHCKKGIKCSCRRCSVLSIGEVRRKKNHIHYDKVTQTDIIESKSKEIQDHEIKYENETSITNLNDVKKHLDDIKQVKADVSDEEIKLQNEIIFLNESAEPNMLDDKNTHIQEEKHQRQYQLNFFTTVNERIKRDTKNIKTTPREVVSSVEIHYASISYMKRVIVSSSSVKKIVSPRPPADCSVIKESKSVHTIFKRRRKCITPNLGISALSLYSEATFNDSKAELKDPQESKQKKPFLRRLMSCLVIRSTRASETNIKGSHFKSRSVDSINSVDSYHINTSLGAMEVTSSLYDTSTSFFSNHTTMPINNKMKRGFFSSVRGLLTNRKS